VLQVEGASIDKRDHAADVCGQIGETLAFDDAIGVALAYQASHPDTLVIVTADHAHTSQMTYSTSPPATGTSFATLQTVDNSPIRVSYGTADTGSGATTSGSQHHTGAQVPVWASGPRAADIQGTIDQTDIFSVLTNTRGPAGAADTTAQVPVGGAVGATLALTLGGDPTFGAFTPGIDKDYTASTSATVVSSAGDATLGVSDPGRLMNGTFSLPSPLEVDFSKSSWTGPVANDPVTISFKQHVGASDALRTGTYSKTLTFTLSTANP
jgi:hypothetical protein